ncbi:MAG: DUF937 domain-containing protein [Arenicellales bacterium]
MAFNIMDLVKEQVTDAVMGQISSALGESSETTSSALSGAIPAILSGLMGVAGNDSGAKSILGALNDQDDGLLGNLGDLLGGNDQSSMIDMGTKVLGGLMGNGGLGNLVGALAGFSGMGKKSSSSLVGLLAPILLGVIKRKVFGGNSGGTLGALTSLFAGQKDNISAAMPSGMNDQLKTSGFFEGLNLGNAADTGRAAMNQAQSQVSEAASGGSSMLRKLVPLLILGALAWFGLKMFGGGGASHENTMNTNTTMSTNTESNMTQMPDYGDQLGSIFKDTTGALTRITDIESAKAQLPNLKNIVSDVDGFSSTFVGLGSRVREPVITLAKGAFDELGPLMGKTLEIPGVGPIIQPTTDSLMEKLNQLMK